MLANYISNFIKQLLFLFLKRKKSNSIMNYFFSYYLFTLLCINHTTPTQHPKVLRGIHSHSTRKHRSPRRQAAAGRQHSTAAPQTHHDSKPRPYMAVVLQPTNSSSQRTANSTTAAPDSTTQPQPRKAPQRTPTAQPCKQQQDSHTANAARQPDSPRGTAEQHSPPEL